MHPRSCRDPENEPVLARLFETITGVELNEEPYAGFVDDLAQLLIPKSSGPLPRPSA
jgi:hypothetical protein